MGEKTEENEEEKEEGGKEGKEEKGGKKGKEEDGSNSDGDKEDAKESEKTLSVPLSSTGNPLVFGKGTVVKCEIDSEANGGTVRFYIDGMKLDEEVSDLYN